MHPKTFNNYWLKEELMDFDVPVEIHLHSYDQIEPNNSIKVLMNFCEPAAFRNITKQQIITHQNKFDLILDFDEDILRECSNAQLMPFGTTWIKDLPPENKKPEVSFLCGGKMITEGHKKRLELFRRQSEVNIPNKFWTSSNFPLIGPFIKNPKLPKELSAKIKLFDCTHHITIENVSQNNWFTEKLIDCFMTKTVPIYIGCPNIADYFNIDGIRHFETIDEILNFLNNGFDAEVNYNWNIRAIEENYQLAQEYARPIEQRLQEKINEYLSNGR